MLGIIFARIVDDFNPRSREGSDYAKYSSLPYCVYFNPRSREGSDIAIFISAMAILVFQSTLPRGERQKHDDRIISVRHISIHAPARGATFKTRQI